MGKRFMIAVSCAFAVGLFSAASNADAGCAQEKSCDLKNVEKGKWCEKCGLDPKVDDKGNCGCGVKPKEIDVCVKTCYECECGKRSDKEKCCEGKKSEKKTVKGRIVFKCEGCGASADKEGDCTKDGCRKVGKKIRKTCETSGTWPHGGEASKK